jgi:hypothetical protein
MNTDDIGTVIKALCVHGARAVSRYAEITGLDPKYHMPEYFMPAYICDHMGDQVVMALEPNFKLLLKGELYAKSDWYKEPSPQELAALHLVTKLGGSRVDMAIFADPHRPKNQQRILALVEFKKWITNKGSTRATEGTWDRDKLIPILKHFTSCKYGVCCGWQNHEKAEITARQEGDLWHAEPFDLLGRKYFFCARVFDASAKMTVLAHGVA